MEDALNRDIIAMKIQLTTNESNQETDRIRKLKAIIRKAKESSASAEAEYIFGVFFQTIVDFETEISKLGSELEKAKSERIIAEKKLCSQARSMKAETREKEREILSLLRREILALLKPSDRRNLRDGIEAVFLKKMDGDADMADTGDDDVAVMTWQEAVGKLGGVLAAVCGGRRD